MLVRHGDHMGPSNAPMGLTGDSREGGVRSYEGPSDVQGEAGCACEGE